MEFSIGLIMLVTSWLHLKNHMMFYLHAAGYRIVPVSLLPLFALTIPWLMLFVGLMIILRDYQPIGAVLGAAIFSSFGIAQAWTILNGFSIDCGCFGSMAQKNVDLVSMTLPIVLAIGCVIIAVSRFRETLSR